VPAARSRQVYSQFETFDAWSKHSWSIGPAASSAAAAATPTAKPAFSPAAEPDAGSADGLHFSNAPTAVRALAASATTPAIR